MIKVLRDIIKFKNIKTSIVQATLDIKDVKGSRELRRFGFNLGLGLTVAGFIMFLRNKAYFPWFLSAGSFVFILSILYPSALKPIG